MGINNKPDQENHNDWDNDPDNWIWGMFYYNPKDNRLFPPKRIKEFGWTINFANPNSVFIALIVIAILLILGEHSNH
ncbi:DUF5808 domain-containing protein [Flavobacterium bizetiae]|uniref:DUF5808 domain-containing protein n=1 Tax=Flavobacterium bizetiae TaxID=2704140 RepID=UPI0021E74BBE|nr:DUF5808 domain-containing protein [Flavobacterium bizetiae]UTN04837.1 DUF5808 domain-containing protein [Flavobacterium bizetiae]